MKHLIITIFSVLTVMHAEAVTFMITACLSILFSSNLATHLTDYFGPYQDQ